MATTGTTTAMALVETIVNITNATTTDLEATTVATKVDEGTEAASTTPDVLVEVMRTVEKAKTVTETTAGMAATTTATTTTAEITDVTVMDSVDLEMTIATGGAVVLAEVEETIDEVEDVVGEARTCPKFPAHHLLLRLKSAFP